ncbi:hypothetical protein BD410DRAFT_841121 [Rickenella mellea]|uniref:Uncharacterized protein n=1 Tax=Rickenella mellea TaxID=50990 RepID=A0A4Y7Q0C7_9AGAM|nr:hypothetical protein BD410DRAFT_841121 [Rickenella mellea]
MAAHSGISYGFQRQSVASFLAPPPAVHMGDTRTPTLRAGPIPHPRIRPRELRSSPLAGPAVSDVEEDDEAEPKAPEGKVKFRPNRISSAPELDQLRNTRPLSVSSFSLLSSAVIARTSRGEMSTLRPIDTATPRTSKRPGSAPSPRTSTMRRSSYVSPDHTQNWMTMQPIPTFSRQSMYQQGVVMPVRATRHSLTYKPKVRGPEIVVCPPSTDGHADEKGTRRVSWFLGGDEAPPTQQDSGSSDSDSQNDLSRVSSAGSISSLSTRSSSWSTLNTGVPASSNGSETTIDSASSAPCEEIDMASLVGGRDADKLDGAAQTRSENVVEEKGSRWSVRRMRKKHASHGKAKPHEKSGAPTSHGRSASLTNIAPNASADDATPTCLGFSSRPRSNLPEPPKAKLKNSSTVESGGGVDLKGSNATQWRRR